MNTLFSDQPRGPQSNPCKIERSKNQPASSTLTAGSNAAAASGAGTSASSQSGQTSATCASRRAEIEALRIAKQQTGQKTADLPAPTILSRKQLAAYLGLCARSIQNLERRGVLPRIKLGKRTIYRLDSVLKSLSRLESEVAK